MIPLLLAARELGRALAAVWRDPETKALPVVAGALVLTGTLFYWRFEDWTIIEALYFCIVTLTTVGYGDSMPTPRPSRRSPRTRARRTRRPEDRYAARSSGRGRYTTVAIPPTARASDDGAVASAH